MTNLSESTRTAWVKTEQVAVLYGHGTLILLANAVNSALVAGVLWRWVGPPVLWWLAVVWLLTLGRAVLFLVYRKARPAVEAADRWAAMFTLGSAASGCAWGIGCILLFVPGEMAAQLVMAYVVAGMAAGAVVALSVWLPAAVSFMTLMGLGQVTAFLLQGGPLFLVLAIMACLMWAVFCAVAIHFNRSLVRALDLRFDNLILGDRLERAQLSEVGNQAKSRFFAAMSHELRTPLNAILGFSEIIKSEMFGPVGPSQYKDYVEGINDSAARLLKMIDEILMLSSIEAGGVKLDEKPLDLRAAVAAALEKVREAAEAGGVRLTTKLCQSCMVLRADDFAFKQILLKLLCDAIRFSPRGGEVTVVTGLDEEGHFVLKVADSGGAVARQDQPGTVAELGGIDSSVAAQIQGPGFGLSVVKALVEIHGGRVDVKSEPALGTTIVARFPSERVFGGAPAAAARPREQSDEDRDGTARALSAQD